MALKTIRFTSKYHNEEKFNVIFEIDQKVKDLKNKMSQHILDNFDRVLFDKWNLIKEYKQFKIPELSAWETQAIFQDIIGLYENQLQRKKQNIDFKIQTGIKITHYKKKTKTHEKGDVKSAIIQTKKTELCKVTKYLVYCDLNKPLPEKIIHNYKDREWFPKLLEFVKQKQQSLIKNIRLITFNSGTHRKVAYLNKKLCESFIFNDSTNSKYKWWYVYKTPMGKIYLPLQINKRYHDNIEQLVRFKAECYVKVTGDKIHILTTREHTGYSFKEFTDIIGIDLNVKNNFCFLSDGVEIDYDRKWIGQAVKELNRYDKNFTKTEKQKNRISKIARRNEWYFQKLVHDILDQLEENDVSDVVMEDLDLSFGATFIKHPDFDIKYSRLVQLLRLSNIKKWFIEQANKRGIRVHLTNPAYTSQTCPVCGSITRDNRKTQEVFECVECGHTTNADHNSAINIRNRISLDVLRNQLHIVDSNGIYTPKKMKLSLIKGIISDYYV